MTEGIVATIMVSAATNIALSIMFVAASRSLQNRPENDEPGETDG